ncbi:hemolysin, partial [Erwinia tracheiphila PSU-1]
MLFKLLFVHRFEAFSVATYLLMGWLSLIVICQLTLAISPGGVWLLAWGGIIYSPG